MNQASKTAGAEKGIARRSPTVPSPNLVLLIVDDEADLADTCARVLKRAGFDCIPAYDAAAALELFNTTCPALVLSDINLPDGDGYQIARHVRDRSPHIPVILMTAHPNSQTADRAARAGAACYLGKPFSNLALRTAVESLLESAPNSAIA